MFLFRLTGGVYRLFVITIKPLANVIANHIYQNSD
jgi:hypothetical protein